jgi:hypothetical protein
MRSKKPTIGIDIRRDKPIAVLCYRDDRQTCFKALFGDDYDHLAVEIERKLRETPGYEVLMDAADVKFLQEQRKT